MNKVRLMVPGPVEVETSVLREMSIAQVAHYSEEAISLYNECVNNLKLIAGDIKNTDVFILVGSGSIAMDSCLASVVGNNDKILVATNGNFGDRLTVQAKCIGADVSELRVEPGKAIRGDMIEDAIKKNSRIRAIALVHLETTNGVLNPIKEIGEVARKFGIPLIVDSVSSFGVEDFNMQDFGVSLSGTGVQKGLETPPGLGISFVSENGWQAIKNRKKTTCAWTLDLLTWLDHVKNNKVRKDIIYPLMVTMPVNNIRALAKSLQNILEESIEKRLERHKKISEIVKIGCRNLGFEDFPEEGFSAHGVSVMKNTLNIDISEMIYFLRQNYNTQISNGLFDLSNKIFRIGHIGQTSTLDNIVPVLFGIEHYLRRKGFNIKNGDSLIGVG
jgi:alanine-glyoxylate transaminase / serine-glyoxylate transaminase / serine-pyruvate transaminase